MITIKEELISSSKLRRAIKLGGHEAVTLWLALKAYAACHPTDGFVPADIIESESERLGIKKHEKALRALLDCGSLCADGSRGAGLVDEHDHGCVLHDYLDHAMSSDELVERQMKDRERKRLQRDRAKLRTVLMSQGYSGVDAEMLVRNMSHDEVTNQLNLSHAVSRDLSHYEIDDVTHESSRARAPASADARTDARACPSPAQPSLSVNPKAEGVDPRLPGHSDVPPVSPPPKSVAQHKLERRHLDATTKSFLPIEDASPFPADFAASPANVAFAETHGLVIADEIAALRNNALSKGRISCAWQAELETWMRRSWKYQREAGERTKRGGGTHQPNLGRTGWEED